MAHGHGPFDHWIAPFLRRLRDRWMMPFLRCVFLGSFFSNHHDKGPYDDSDLDEYATRRIIATRNSLIHFNEGCSCLQCRYVRVLAVHPRPRRWYKQQLALSRLAGDA